MFADLYQGSPGTGSTSIYERPPAIIWQVDAEQTYTDFARAGTGGVENFKFLLERFGYAIAAIEPASVSTKLPPFAQRMLEVREGFGRTMSHLPTVFGVSRQTLYNWINGAKSPAPEHEERIRELAAAAQVFAATGFRPSAAHLNRTLTQGKSFLELLAEGFDGNLAASRLVALVERGAASRAKLDALTSTRRRDGTVSDAITPTMDE